MVIIIIIIIMTIIIVKINYNSGVIVTFSDEAKLRVEWESEIKKINKKDRLEIKRYIDTN